MAARLTLTTAIHKADFRNYQAVAVSAQLNLEMRMHSLRLFPIDASGIIVNAERSLAQRWRFDAQENLAIRCLVIGKADL